MKAINRIPLRFQIVDNSNQGIDNDDDEVYYVHPDEALQAILRDVNTEPHYPDKKDQDKYEKEKKDYFVQITQ